MNTQLRYLVELARHDLSKQDRDSIAGVVWFFLRPTLFVLLLYMVFKVGLRSAVSLNVPFALFVIVGFVPWLFFSEIVGSAARLLREYAFLVRSDFRLELLPVSRMLSFALVHLWILLLCVSLCWLDGLRPDIYVLLVVYYFIALAALLVPLCWIVAATSLFVRDVNHIVGMLVQFGFWLTPILWPLDAMPERFRWIIQMNPLSYIVNGYRDALLWQTPPSPQTVSAVYFWAFVLALWVIGYLVHRRLRPHFGEVLA